MIGYEFIFYIPISLVLIFVGYKKKSKDNLPGWYWLTFICSLTYINCAIDKLFFPIFYDLPEDIILSTRINMELDFSKMMNMQIFYNILVTVPLAICLLFVIRSNINRIVIYTVFCSVLIEVIQLIIILTIRPGNMFFDIMDIMLNLLGGIIGCVVLVVMRRIATCITKKDGIIGYISDTLLID